MIIASRTLTLRKGDRSIEIPIDVFAPESERPGVWKCRNDVGWREGVRSYAGWGADSVQALLIALGMIGAEIYSSNYHKSGNLFWQTPGNGYGFPVAPTLRDLLEGDDRTYL
jgi:hypothetical protein